MPPKEKRDRLAQSMTDATFGYFAAATATYSHIAAESIRAWAEAATPESTNDYKPKSWYQPPPPSMRKPDEFTSFPMLFNPWQPGSKLNWAASPAIPSAITTWPAAMTLISAGVPRAIAWPLAEANCASQDVSALTLESLSEAIASYSSMDTTDSTSNTQAKPDKVSSTFTNKTRDAASDPNRHGTSAAIEDSAAESESITAPYANFDDAADIMATWNELSEKLAQNWLRPNAKCTG
ncbi:MAG: hypothetical protein ACRBCJ_12255 [Hyphomicrobiaceae bacterium]